MYVYVTLRIYTVNTAFGVQIKITYHSYMCLYFHVKKVGGKVFAFLGNWQKIQRIIILKKAMQCFRAKYY